MTIKNLIETLTKENMNTDNLKILKEVIKRRSKETVLTQKTRVNKKDILNYIKYLKYQNIQS